MSKESTKSRSQAASGSLAGNGGGMSDSSGTQEDGSGPMAGVANLAHEAADQVKHAASSGASSVKRQVSDALDRQVSSGADMISQVASSTRRAADDLERQVPQLAGMIRTMANTADTYAEDLRNKSVEDIIRSASDFTRRQPAMVFGFAAMAGFLAFRLLKAAPDERTDQSRSSDMAGDRPGDIGYGHGSAETRMGGSGDHVY